MFRPYGYTNFYVNISDKVKFGKENELLVIAHNADQPNSRWYSGAGIYRPVWLWAAPKEHIQINGLRVRTVSIEPATVEITVLTQGRGEACIEIYDGGKTVVSGKAQSDGKCTLMLTIPNAKLWSPESPDLYTCKASFGADSDKITFGVRTWTWGQHGWRVQR